MAIIFLEIKRLNPTKSLGQSPLLVEGRRERERSEMAATAAAAAAAAALSSSSASLEAEQFKADLRKQIRSHEVAIAELNSLSSSRAVYQKNINILFRSSIPKVTANEQKQLDLAKAKLQKLN